MIRSVSSILVPPSVPVTGGTLSPFPILPIRVVPGREGRSSPDRDEVQALRAARNRRLEANLFMALYRQYQDKYKKDGSTVLIAATEEEDSFYDFVCARELTSRLIASPSVKVVLRPAFLWCDLRQEPSEMMMGARAAALIRQKEDGKPDTFLLADLRAVANLYTTSHRLSDDGNLTPFQEVKAGLVQELAVKVYLARASGIPVSQAGILHLSSQMVHDGDPTALLEYADFTQEMPIPPPRRETQTPGTRVIVSWRAPVHRARNQIQRTLAAHHRVLSRAMEQAAAGSAEARTPINHLYQYGLLKNKLAKLETKIQFIEELAVFLDQPDPPIKLNPIQRRQVTALKTRQLVVEDKEGLQRELQNLVARVADARTRGGKISFFDMEGAHPDIAIMRGTRNGQKVPLQFSCHSFDPEGRLDHVDYTYQGDPQAAKAGEILDKEYAEQMLKAVGPVGPILVWYAPHERARIRELARRLAQQGEVRLADKLDELTGDALLKDLAKKLEQEGKKDYARQLRDVIELGEDRMMERYVEKLRKTTGEETTKSAVEARELADSIEKLLGETRLVDLLTLFQNHTYHPDLIEFFKLKSVLKAFFPDRNHDHLEVRKGREASRAWEEMLDPATTPERRERLRKQLLDYCGRDTEAEVWLLEKLFELAGLEWPFRQHT